MNLHTIQQIPYMKKKVLVKEACLMYSKVKLAAIFLGDQEIAETKEPNALQDFVQKSHVENHKTSSLFESAINLLTSDERRVIDNDFMTEENAQWWVGHWAKSTYYKIKHQAVDKFLYLFYV